MVVGAFPLSKLGYLVVKQISKPVADQIKNAAKRNKVFRRYICLPTAQLYHKFDTSFKLSLLGFGKPEKVAALNEQMAVNLGAEILGEALVFIFAAATMIFEYNRQANKTKSKEDDLLGRLESLESKLDSLILQGQRHDNQIRRLTDNEQRYLDKKRKHRLKNESDNVFSTQFISSSGTSGWTGKRRVTLEKSDVLHISDESMRKSHLHNRSKDQNGVFADRSSLNARNAENLFDPSTCDKPGHLIVKCASETAYLLFNKQS